MKFVIDRGNTLYKTAVFDNEDLVWQKSFERLTLESVQEIFSKWHIEKTIFCSVGASEQDELIDYLKENSRFVSMSEDLQFPIKIAYKTLSTLGKDRIASVVGAFDMFKGRSVVVIDAGSCICFEYLDKDSVYRGGSISLGFAMKYKALHNFTANLPLLEMERGRVNLCGGQTEECIHSGIVNGTLCEVEGMLSAYLEKDKDLVVVLTGGDADLIAQHLSGEVIVEKHLVLKGLNVILDANTK